MASMQRLTDQEPETREAATASTSLSPGQSPRGHAASLLPGQFDGKHHWRDWSFVMRSFLAAKNPNAPQYLRLAENSTEPVLNATLSTHQAHFSASLHHVLAMFCEEQAMDRVLHAGVGEGLEAWRSLVQCYEPVTTAHEAQLSSTTSQTLGTQRSRTDLLQEQTQSSRS